MVELPLKIFISVALFVGLTKAENTIRVFNRCRETIWVAGRPDVRVDNAGGISTGQHTIARVPSQWSGIIWAKTGCDSGCDSDAPSVPFPVTIAEFTFNAQHNHNYDSYDVSNVDGANLPMEIRPLPPLNPPPNSGNTCGVANCRRDIRQICPQSLQYVSKGRVAGCKNDRSSTARNLYLRECPAAYAFEKDDRNTFTCRAARPGHANYEIVMCP